MKERIRFIGCGTGRSGTVALAKIVSACNGMWCYHETLDALDWEVNDEQFRNKFVWFNSSKKSIGDVAYWYLPYIEKFIQAIPEIKVVIIQRDKDETVESWLKWFPLNVFLGQCHTKSYPCIGVDDHRKAVEVYWDTYYLEADRLQTEYPANVKIFHITDLECPDEIFDFIGIGVKDMRYIDNPKYNQS